ncbi:MAG: hypothetical protein CMA77_06210, partial [Euryarchaeota archaeon]|nr:hypothetical protein [Euryarchaeota archaeon]
MEHQVSTIEKVAETLILPLFEGIKKPPNRSLVGLSRSAQTQVKGAIGSADFDGKSGKSMTLWDEECKVLLVGMGKSEDLDENNARDAGAKMVASFSKTHGKNLTVRFTSGWKANQMVAFAEGMMLRDYKFDKYLSKDEDDEDDNRQYNVNFQASDRHQERLSKGCDRVSSICVGVHIARDLGNEPANKLYPMEYASRAESFAKDKDNLTVTVLDWDQLHENKMGGLINVGKGSEHKP